MRLSKTFQCVTERVSTEEQGMADERSLDMIRAHLKKQFGLSEAQINSMLPSFLSTLAGYMEELGTHFSEGNREEVGRVAHTTKGALLNLGMHNQAELAKEIELRAKAGDDLIELESTFRRLQADLEMLRD